jgi:hypothetical protein
MAGEKPPALEALDLLRSRALRDAEVAGDDTEWNASLRGYVMEQLALVL